MALSSTIDVEYKICRICMQTNAEAIAALEVAANGDSLDAMLKEILSKLQIPYDDDLVTTCCSTCKEELTTTYHFIKKVEDANRKISKLEQYAVEPESGDPLDRPIVEVKFEAVDKYSDTQSVADDGDSDDDVPLAKRKTSLRKVTKRYQKKEDSSDEDDFIPDDRDEDVEGSDEENKTKSKRTKYAITADSLPRRCCGCREPVSTHEQLEEHSEKFHQRNKAVTAEVIEQKPHECTVCFERFETRKDHLLHKRKIYAENLHCCKRCPADFANAYNLREHLRVFHKRVAIIRQIDEMRQNLHKCCSCKCRKQFDTRELLEEHGKKVHKKRRIVYDSENQFECEICFRRFKTDRVLIEHQRRPYRAYRFQCSHCGKTFKEKQAFRHHEQTHVNLKPYECPICQRTFSLKPNFLTHVRYHSVPDDQFKCEFCSKGFKKKHLLQEHKVIHSETADRPFKCHLCPNTFTTKERMEFHIKDHLGEKPFKCPKCSASYIHERDLRRHDRVKHDPGSSFICEFCSKPFIRREAYNQHLRTHMKE